MLTYDQLQEVAVCLSGVEQEVEDIASTAGLTVEQAKEALLELRRRGISVRKDNSLRSNSKVSEKKMAKLCAGWKPRG